MSTAPKELWYVGQLDSSYENTYRNKTVQMFALPKDFPHTKLFNYTLASAYKRKAIQVSSLPKEFRSKTNFD